MINKKNVSTVLVLLIYSLTITNCFAASEDKLDITHKSVIYSLIHLASEHRNQGEPSAAIEVLNQALILAEKINDKAQLSLIYGGLSDSFLLSRRLDKALDAAKTSVDLARETMDSLTQASALNYYANVLVATQHYEQALATYQQGIKLARVEDDPAMTVKLYLNIIHAHLAGDSFDEANEILTLASLEIKKISDSHEKPYLLVALGHLAQRLHFKNNANIRQSNLLSIAYTSYTDALNIANAKDDIRGQSFALGHLGELYTAQQRYTDAEQLFRQATFFSTQIDAPDLTARWWWQRGRLLKAQDKTQEAEIAYKKSLTHLVTIQPTMVYGHRGNPQFFAKTVGVIYLEYLDILLHKASSIKDNNNKAKILKTVRNVMEQFKTVELKNYFQDDCVTELQSRNSAKNIDDYLSAGTATLYPIIFFDRVTLLLSFADGSIKQFTKKVSAEKLASAVKTFHRELEPTGNPRRLRTAGKVLYDWLIEPLESELTNYKVKTLVIVPDGILGTIPFAALHDGDGFLVNKYAFVTSPGLSLTLTDEETLAAIEQNALLNGLSSNEQQFNPLPYVQNEIQKVAEQFKNSTQLLNEDFKKLSVENQLQLKPYTTVLFASHAELKANPKESYILTYDDKISLNELSRFLRIGKYRENPVNLLVLSACNTARGDERAAFGLAGVAVKAGVSSVLASLWAVNDQSTSELIPLFFENLKHSKFTKALALQQAQKKMLTSANYSHLHHWASFVLFGNWL